MTQEQAQAVVDSLKGWNNARIEGGEYGEDDYFVTAVNPLTRCVMVYNSTTGYFEG